MKNNTIHKDTSRYFRWFIFTSLTLLIYACGDYEETYTPEQATVPKLAASSDTLELKQKQADNTALSLTWSAGSNRGTNAAVQYTLQVDRKGNDFASPVEYDLGKASYSMSFKTGDFNNLLLQSLSLDPESYAEVEFRVLAEVVGQSFEPGISNIVTVKVKPYELVNIPDNLYMVGDATPNGWDAAQATPMTKNNNDPGVFTYQGQLNAGELKFLTVPGEWLPSYQRGEDDNTLVLRTDFSQPDEKFKITKGGLYRITVDVIELTYKQEELESAPYDELWIVGDAVPKGWDIDNADKMLQNPADPFVFIFNEELKVGEFKIATAKSWSAPFYRPLSNHPDITETGVQLSAGDPDHKWYITDPGPYKITLDLRTMTISIDPYTPYPNIYMVGDATPAGWNIDNPVPLTKESDYIFTWTGPLTAGEFKFPIATGDWTTGYFMPYFADESITSTLMTFRPTGSPDMKWRVKPEEEGTYKITLDQLRHSISIVKQ